MVDMHQTILKVFETRDHWSPLPVALRRSRNYLGKLFFETGLNKGAEIGVRRGAFSAILCEANPNIDITCVDPWIGRTSGYSEETQTRYYDAALKQLAPFNATILRKKSMDALADFKNESLGFVFIDGDHRFDHCMFDTISWSRKVKRGGIVACHDYSIAGNVGIAIEAFVRGHHIDPWYKTRERDSTAFWVKP